MLKNSLILFLSVLFFQSCYEPERNCKDYRTGTFKFVYQIDGVDKEGQFVRGEKYSVDYFEGKVDSATIRWYNDCEFILQDINSKAALQYKIISTTDSSYTFQYKNAVKNPNKKLVVKTGTAIKIK